MTLRQNENELAKPENQRSGVVLVIVMCFTAIAAILAIGLLTESMTKVRIVKRQVELEQAFYVAEGGAERGVSYIRNAGAVPGAITGTIGIGKYNTMILDVDEIAPSGGTHTAAGSININPNSSPDNEFLLVTTDGICLTRDDLVQDQQDSSGTAYLVHVKPKGAGSQNGLTVDGDTYTLQNNTAYTFSSVGMAYSLTNANRNPQGKAVGQWWININGASVSINEGSTGGGALQSYTILSVGTVSSARRTIVLEGLHQQSWARYALWYDRSSGPIWITGTETFLGPVHANTTLYLSGNPVFLALLSTTASGWGAGSSVGGVTFVEGWEFNSATQTMASVNFTNLLASASLVVTGSTRITLSNTNLLITNPKKGWTNNVVPVPSTGLIYVATSGTNLGTVSIGGTLDGQLTIAVDRDISITNHVTYAVHPTNNSDDALGLIAKNNVIVTTNAPTNLNLFAHIISTGTNNSYTSGFYVQNYSSRPYSGKLNVYGGIVEYMRGAVGLADQSAGFSKNYVYDTRFATEPPPFYPAITNEYQWKGWRDKLQ